MKHHCVTITFDRVFDIVRARGYETPEHTLFGFEAGSRKYYGVKVPGHPRIEGGDTVTAILINPANWQTLQGWVNHQTQEIAAPSFWGAGIVAIASLVIGGYLLSIMGFSSNGLLAVPFLLAGAYWLWYTANAARIQRDLRKNAEQVS